MNSRKEYKEMTNAKTTIAVIGLILHISPCNAQEPMTLKDCMEYAVSNSEKIRIRQTETDDARTAKRDAILRAFTPEISAGTYAYSNFGRSVDPETNTYVSTTSFNNGYSVSGGITLFNGFSAVNSIRISKTALNMGIQQEQLQKDEICLSVMQAYYNAVYFSRLAEILDTRAETSRKALALADRQMELGQKGYADVIGMEAELADCEYRLISARNMYSDAILTLKDLMSWPPEKALSIDTSITENEKAVTLSHNDDIQQTVSHAAANLPSIAIARGTMENARTELKTAKWSFTPSLSLNAGWSTNYYTYPGQPGHVPVPFPTQFTNNGGEYIQFSLSFPIFSRLSAFSSLRRKRNACTRATLQYEQKLREVETEVIRAVQDRNGASAAFRQADRRAYVQEEAYHLNIRKYEQGIISAIDFSKASDSWQDAQAARLDALLKYYIRRSVVNYYNGISYLDQE